MGGRISTSEQTEDKVNVTEDPFTINVPLGFVLTHPPIEITRVGNLTKTRCNTFQNLQLLYSQKYTNGGLILPPGDILFECTDKTVDLTPYKPWLEANNIKIKE